MGSSGIKNEVKLKENILKLFASLFTNFSERLST